MGSRSLEDLAGPALDELLAALEDLDRTTVCWADLDIWTRDNPPRLVPLALNPVQSRLTQDLCRAYSVDHLWQARGMRVNVLKARQQGMSTLWLAVWYQMLYNLEYCQIVIITHRTESTNMLWQRVQLWEQRLRANSTKRLPRLGYSNRKELVRKDTGSSLFIATAGADDVARSGTITSVHLSETAFWPAGTDSIRVGILGTLPDWGNLIEESTANGMGAHYERYEDQKSTPGIYRTFFFPWSATPEYATTPPSGFTLSKQEQQQQAACGLSLEQVAWARNRRAEFAANGEPERFVQEFPLTDLEAFVSSGNAYFNTAYLKWLSDEMRKPENRAVYEGLAAEHYANAAGMLLVWEDPEPDHRYVIGADDAQGIEKKGKDHDYSTADVFDVETYRQVASYFGRIDPTDFGDLLDLLGKDFNRAEIIVENDPRGFGLRTVERLQELHYPRIYQHKPEDIEEGQKTEDLPYGYPANQRTKRLRNDLLAKAINQAAEGYGDFLVRAPRAISELMKYVKVEGNRAEGEGRAHDDHVTSVGLAHYLLETYPRVRKPPPPPPKAGGYGRSVGRRER